MPKGTDVPDWRDGLVVLPAGHVFGATALPVAEVERRAARRRRLHVGQEPVLVLEERCAHTGVILMDHEYRDRAAAFGELGHRIEMSPGAFGARRGLIRMVLTEVWR